MCNHVRKITSCHRFSSRSTPGDTIPFLLFKMPIIREIQVKSLHDPQGSTADYWVIGVKKSLSQLIRLPALSVVPFPRMTIKSNHLGAPEYPTSGILLAHQTSLAVKPSWRSYPGKGYKYRFIPVIIKRAFSVAGSHAT